jgi:hypothetical protein
MTARKYLPKERSFPHYCADCDKNPVWVEGQRCSRCSDRRYRAATSPETEANVYRKMVLLNLRVLYPGIFPEEELIQRYRSDPDVQDRLEKYGLCAYCGISPGSYVRVCSICDDIQMAEWRIKHPCPKYRHSGHSSIDCWDLSW